MQQATYLLGSLVKVAVAGVAWDDPTSGTVGRDSIPPNDATAAYAPVWLDLGIIEEASEQVDSTAIEIFRPSPGVLQLSDVKETKLKRMLSLTVGECSNVMWLLLRRCLKASSPFSGNIGQHVPLSGGTQKMWVKIQNYDGETNALLLAEQIWAHAKVDGAVSYGGEKQVQFKLQLTQLWSPLTAATGN